MSNGGGIPLPGYSTTGSLKSLSVSINFIDKFLKGLESNFSYSCRAHQDKMRELFANSANTNTTPTSLDFKNKLQLLLKYIRGEWYINKLLHLVLPSKKT